MLLCHDQGQETYPISEIGLEQNGSVFLALSMIPATISTCYSQPWRREKRNMDYPPQPQPQWPQGQPQPQWQPQQWQPQSQWQQGQQPQPQWPQGQPQSHWQQGQ